MVTSAVSSTATSTSTTASSTTTSSQTLANNFQTFLTLLTTQLQNQSPLDPLDTNQFTQQLVQFAQVEQQMKQNEQLASLVTMQKTMQLTQALNFVGTTAVVDGSTAELNGTATWTMNAPEAASATITVKSASGETAYSGNFNVESGLTNFTWDGKGTDGTTWPAGKYTISVTAKNSSGASVAMSTEIQGKVEAVDVSKDPPVLTIGGLNFSLSQIKLVVSST